MLATEPVGADLTSCDPAANRGRLPTELFGDLCNSEVSNRHGAELVGESADEGRW
jgi:hypothetical protein